ncbi:LysM peptidoglycan-binding domain-containing protein [Streptomyces roseoverticillatus]|uniref:LysM peptidoglycan-binding domain-containing protein n=1 Tax=Streptomyces roseoverticillatus TaxID=66429 RepID=UPI001F2D3983|nr:LysM peptidoglycan-binding domain-containing protein [Streptomyces roseoverticillatus]MCF3100976.1 LysM peptidoglycan-binding domain-containing protein [Streptomyces roseoverticillatus]
MAGTAASMANLALTQVGYKEGANNYNKYAEQTPGLQVDWAIYGPWCQSFISWLAWKTGNRDVIPTTASCSVCTDYYKERGAFSRTPRVGSLAMFGSDGGTHVELVIAVYNGGADIEVVGGNTKDYPAPNGDGVYRKRYNNWASTTRIHGFGHPAYSGAGVINDRGGSSGKYKIKAGQTLSGIAAVLGVTLASLLAANPQISDPDDVHEDQEISVPAKPAEKPKPSTDDNDKPTPTVPDTGSATGTYTVRSGDSLSAIARAHGMSLSRLLALNPVVHDPDVIAAGHVLKVTGSPRPAPSTGGTEGSKTPAPKPRPTPEPSKRPDWTDRFDRIDRELREVKDELGRIKEQMKDKPQPPKPEPEPTKPVEPPVPVKPTKPEPPVPVSPEVSRPTDIPVVPQQVIPTPEVKSAA